MEGVCTSYASAAGFVENAKVSVLRTSPYSITVDRGPWRRRLASFTSGICFQPDSDTPLSGSTYCVRRPLVHGVLETS